MNPPEELPITNEVLLQTYFKARRLRPATKTSYQIVFNVLKQAIPNTLPDDLSQAQLLGWRQHSMDNGLTANSWNSYMRHLHAVFGFGMEKGYLNRTHNPVDGLYLPEEKRKKKTLAVEQIAKVIAEFETLHRMEITGRLYPASGLADSLPSGSGAPSLKRCITAVCAATNCCTCA